MASTTSIDHSPSVCLGIGSSPTGMPHEARGNGHERAADGTEINAHHARAGGGNNEEHTDGKGAHESVERAELRPHFGAGDRGELQVPLQRTREREVGWPRKEGEDAAKEHHSDCQQGGPQS